MCGRADQRIWQRGRPDKAVHRQASKMHPAPRQDFRVFFVCDGLAAFIAHVPNAEEYLVRFYGWYSNVNRGKGRKALRKELPRQAS